MTEKEIATILTEEGYAGLKIKVDQRENSINWRWCGFVIFMAAIYTGVIIQDRSKISNYKFYRDAEQKYFCNRVIGQIDSLKNGYDIAKEIKNKSKE